MFARKCKPFVAAAGSAPEVVGVATGNEGSITTSHAISIPTGDNGDLIVVCFACDGNPTLTASGYTQEINNPYSSGGFAHHVLVREATGSDALTITTSASETSAHVTLRIRGLADGYTLTYTAGDGSYSATFDLDPPSLSLSGSAAAVFVAFIAGHVGASDATFDDSAPWEEAARVSSVDGTDTSTSTSTNNVGAYVAYAEDEASSGDSVGWTASVATISTRLTFALEAA